MIEDRFIQTDLTVSRPVASLRAVSHDPTLTHLLERRRRPDPDCGRAAVGVLQPGRRSTSTSAYGDDVDDQTRDVLDRWESVLNRLERDPMECARELDWVAKLQPAASPTATATGWTGTTPSCT